MHNWLIFQYWLIMFELLYDKRVDASEEMKYFVESVGRQRQDAEATAEVDLQ